MLCCIFWILYSCRLIYINILIILLSFHSLQILEGICSDIHLFCDWNYLNIWLPINLFSWQNRNDFNIYSTDENKYIKFIYTRVQRYFVFEIMLVKNLRYTQIYKCCYTKFARHNFWVKIYVFYVLFVI